MHDDLRKLSIFNRHCLCYHTFNIRVQHKLDLGPIAPFRPHAIGRAESRSVPINQQAIKWALIGQNQASALTIPLWMICAYKLLTSIDYLVLSERVLKIRTPNTGLAATTRLPCLGAKREVERDLWILQAPSPTMSPKSKKSSLAAPTVTHAFPVKTDATTPDLYDIAFTEKDANIILQSSDGIFYRMSSFTLRTTSGFFRGMMTLPQSDGISPPDSGAITLDENSAILGRLLRMISGFEIPKWKSFDEVEALLAAAYKYDMPGPLAAARTTFMWPFSAEQPLRLYAVAARYGWEEEAKLASKHSLSLSIHDEEHVSVLERVPSAWLLRLFRLHRERREVLRRSIDDILINHIKDCRPQTDSNWAIPTSASEEHEAQLQTQLWLNLGKTILLEIDRCPAGGVLLNGEWKQWAEAKECLQGRGRCGRCGGDHEYSKQVDSVVQTALQSLPSTI